MHNIYILRHGECFEAVWFFTGSRNMKMIQWLHRFRIPSKDGIVFKAHHDSTAHWQKEYLQTETNRITHPKCNISHMACTVLLFISYLYSLCVIQCYINALLSFNWLGWVVQGLTSPTEHIIGHFRDGFSVRVFLPFYRSKDPTNSINILKE